MIDRRTPPSDDQPTSDRSTPIDPSTDESTGTGSRSDLYADLFSGGPAAEQDSTVTSGAQRNIFPTRRVFGERDSTAEPPQRHIAPPPCPVTLADTGLSLMQICELVLKYLHLQGNLLGIQISRQLRLPFQIVEQGLTFLKGERCIEVATGDMIGPASYRFNLTELGRRRARDAFEACRYVGPAPVSLNAYAEQCRRQAVTGTECSPPALRRAFEGMIVRDDLIEELGPAVCSGRSIFVYGPPGNGKTMIAKGLGRFLNTNGGEIYVPYAVQTEGNVITVYDPTLHDATDRGERPSSGAADSVMLDPERARTNGQADLRWRRIRRPVIIAGGELTLEMLDLRFNKSSNLYSAPLHVKANGGVFFIDDFGRQIVSPRDLLNRWIVPLEEKLDYLTLSTGKKFPIPFEQLILFSTNLDPRELVDEAFLRRIRHKIHIGPPDREMYTAIFRLCCEQRGFEFSPAAVDFLYSRFYESEKPPRSSDPRDLLDIAQSICRFGKRDLVLTPELVADAAARFFCRL